MTRDTERVIQELYALPPGQFTPARNAKAAELRAAGQPDQARAVGRLRRPPPALWATNRLARLEPERLDAFIDTVKKLRRTQLRDPRTAADALRRHRADLDTLARRAGELLTHHGHRATPALQRRIADTLLGAVVDQDSALALRAGRLTTELPAPGFEVLAGTPRAPLRLVSHGETAGKPEARVRPPRREADRQTDRRARQAERETAARQERERRQRVAKDLERETQTRRAAADATRRELEELVRKTSAARDRLREAQRAVRAAASAGRKARRAADRRPAKTTPSDGHRRDDDAQ